MKKDVSYTYMSYKTIYIYLSLFVFVSKVNIFSPYYRGGLLGLCGMNPIINSFGGQFVNACLLFEEFHTPCILTKNV
jgi:hypothetical protein